MDTLEKISKIREEKKKELDLRINTKSDTRQKHILVCHGTRMYFFKITTNSRKL